MARGRMLNRRISEDHKVAQLIREAGPLAGLLYTWTIAHLDCEGRCNGTPAILRGRVAPLLDVTDQQVHQMLACANRLGLIVWYETNGGRFVYYPKFQENQYGLRKDREARSEIPAPTPDQLRSNSGKTPREVEDQDQDQDQGEGKKNTSAEPEKTLAPAPPMSPVSITIPTSGKHTEDYPVTEADVQEWHEAYPAVAIMQELREMRQWAISNPSRRKTARGMRRFITAWLEREQNRGGARAPPGAAFQPRAEYKPPYHLPFPAKEA